MVTVLALVSAGDPGDQSRTSEGSLSTNTFLCLPERKKSLFLASMLTVRGARPVSGHDVSWSLLVVPTRGVWWEGASHSAQISQEGLHGGDPAASLKWDPTLLFQQSAPHFGWLFCFASFSIDLSLDSFPQIERIKMNVVWKSHAQHRVGAP